MLELNKINKIYESKKGSKINALKDVSIKFENTGIVFILGKSGSGKSTLLNVIGGLDNFDSGELHLFNKNIKEFSDADLDYYRNTYLGFVFQEFNLLEDLDVNENVSLSLKLQQKNNEEKVEKILEELELIDLKKRKINELSGGQKQRVAIARALIKNPKIILADEPTGNLDTDTGIQVMNLLEKISKDRLVIIVSHDEELAKKYASRIIRIKDGKIIEDKLMKKYESTSKIKREYIKLINSKLPFFDSLKFGVSTIFSKKIRFLLTILLVIFTLTIFGSFSIISSFDHFKSHADLLSVNNESYIYLQKGNAEEYENLFTNEDIKKLSQELDEYNIIKVNSDENAKKITYKSIGIDFPNIDGIDAPLYYTASSDDNLNFVLINENGLKYEMIGRLPSNSDEIAITNYIADHIIKFGILKENEKITVADYSEILNNNISINIDNQEKKIVGIIKYDMNKYSFYKDKTYNDLTDEEKKSFDGINQTLLYKKEYLYNNLFVVNEFFDDNYKMTVNAVSTLDNKTYTLKATSLSEPVYYYDGKNKKKITSLEENQAILNVNLLMNDSFNDKFMSYVSDNQSKNIDLENLKLDFINEFLDDSDVIGKEINIDLIAENSDKILKSAKGIQIIGVYFSDTDNKTNYFSPQLVEPYLESSLKVSKIIIKADTKKEMENLLSKYDFLNSNDESIVAKTPYSYNIETSVNSLLMLKNLAQISSVVLFVFSALLISNFITVTIKYKEKDIGILRAIGASKRDIFKIFIWEGLIMGIISLAVSTILLFPIIHLLNINFSSNLRFELHVLFFDSYQILRIASVLFILIFVSSMIPIRKISSKRPIDAINLK